MTDQNGYDDELIEETGVIIAGKIPVDKENDPDWLALTVKEDEHKRKWTYDANGKSICGAVTRAGKPCRNSPVTGRNRCRKHGGASLTGIQHPNAKTLRYSRSILDRKLANMYEEALADPALLSLRNNIAVSDVRISELLSSVNVGESLAAWRALRDTYDAFVEAHNKGDSVGAVENLHEMGRLIKTGLGEHEKWREIKEYQAHRRQLSETEHKMQHDKKQTMTAEQAMSLLAFAVSTVRKNLFKFFPNKEGERCMAAISQELSAKLYSNPNPAAKSASINTEDF